MKSELCSSSAISLSRHFQTYARRWRHRHRRVERAGTGSPACACDGSSPGAAGTRRGLNRNRPFRIPALAPKLPVAKTLTPRPPRPPPRLVLVFLKTSYGRSSTSYSGRAFDYEMKRNCCEGNWTRGIRKRRRNLSPEPCRLVAAIAPIWCVCGVSETRYSPMRRSWKPPRQSVRLKRPPHRSEDWILPWKRRPDRRASPLRTRRSSLRFSSRVIPSNFKDNCSSPPFRIRLV